jgi:DNA-binding IclR family transcriptional regulator
MAAGLTRIAGRIAAILDVLNDEPISVRALAREVGIPPTTAHDYLAALSANGRAQLTPDGWTRPSAEILFGDRSVHPNESENRGVT